MIQKAEFSPTSRLTPPPWCAGHLRRQAPPRPRVSAAAAWARSSRPTPRGKAAPRPCTPSWLRLRHGHDVPIIKALFWCNWKSTNSYRKNVAPAPRSPPWTCATSSASSCPMAARRSVHLFGGNNISGPVTSHICRNRCGSVQRQTETQRSESFVWSLRHVDSSWPFALHQQIL